MEKDDFRVCVCVLEIKMIESNLKSKMPMFMKEMCIQPSLLDWM